MLHPTEKYYPLRPELAESTLYLYQATKGLVICSDLTLCVGVWVTSSIFYFVIFLKNKFYKLFGIHRLIL